MKSVLKFDINLFDEYKDLVEDLVKYITIYVVYNFMYSYVNDNEMLSNEFIMNIIYMSIGIIFYNLVIRKIIKLS
jgi:hypothetical protein